MIKILTINVFIITRVRPIVGGRPESLLRRSLLDLLCSHKDPSDPFGPFDPSDPFDSLNPFDPTNPFNRFNPSLLFLSQSLLLPCPSPLHCPHLLLHRLNLLLRSNLPPHLHPLLLFSRPLSPSRASKAPPPLPPPPSSTPSWSTPASPSPGWLASPTFPGL